ncbi:hypothetical protein FTRO_0010030 [Fructobacillus tropaeoli]|uniref:Uncharacterized protein n=2 Tax=Fructobacillus tropaeoli TaxID=709323 RepID=A0A3F3GVV1_9LACO|nr:hypothetical protein FTRO_0010030 [Fructobacillus tropaeoli]
MLLLTIPIVILLLPMTIWFYIYIFTGDFLISRQIFKIVFFYNRADRRKREENFIQKDLREELIHLSSMADKKVVDEYELTADQAKDLKSFARYISKHPKSPFVSDAVLNIILRNDWLRNLQQTLTIFSKEETVIAYKKLLQMNPEKTTGQEVRKNFQEFIKVATNDILVRKALNRELDRMLMNELSPQEEKQFFNFLESPFKVDTKFLLRTLVQSNYAHA